MPFSSVCSHACEEFGFNNPAETIPRLANFFARCAKMMKNKIFSKQDFSSKSAFSHVHCNSDYSAEFPWQKA